MMHTYSEVLDYLYKQLPMYQRQGATAYRKDLSNILAITQVLQSPERDFKTIHIAGTNGKGSTSHILAAMLQSNGLKVGLYTSPHYIDFRERVRINGAMITEEEVIHFVNRYKAVFDDIQPSFFEWSVALAFYHFSQNNVDIAVIETGLGGRLDSTNIVHPILSVITNVDLDHMQFLGTTKKAIAKEKAGIIKKGVPAVLGEYNDEYASVIEQKAEAMDAPLVWAQDFCSVQLIDEMNSSNRYLLEYKHQQYSFTSDLGGLFQAYNFRTAFAAYELLRKESNIVHVDLEQALGALKNIRESTGLLGRWQLLHSHPPVILDGAHNHQALEQAIEHFMTYDAERRYIVIGLSSDKKLDDFINYLPKSALYFCCQANVPRSLPVKELYDFLRMHQYKATLFPSVLEAYKSAFRKASEFDAILVTGSIFTTGELLAELKKES